jgi:hypothetical protein
MIPVTAAFDCGAPSSQFARAGSSMSACAGSPDPHERKDRSDPPTLLGHALGTAFVVSIGEKPQ